MSTGDRGAAVVGLLRDRGACSLEDIAVALLWSRTTVAKVLGGLVADRKVSTRRAFSGERRTGRRAVVYEVSR